MLNTIDKLAKLLYNESMINKGTESLKSQGRKDEMAPDRKYYAVMSDKWGDMTIVYDDIVKAYQKVVNDMYYFPDGCIREIENGLCIREIEQKDFDEVYRLAANIIKAKTWMEAYEDLDHLMNLLDMDAEWIEADGDTFQDVIEKAGKKIGVELV